jgi:hypothetical protein
MTRLRRAAAIREARRKERERITAADAEQAAQEQGEQDREGRAEKVRENRLRRMAQRQGLRLEKSRRRDRRALGYGTYMLVDPHTNTIEAGDHQHGYGMTLVEIERALNTLHQCGCSTRYGGPRTRPLARYPQ